MIPRIQTQKERAHLVLLNTDGAPCLGTLTRRVDTALSQEGNAPPQSSWYPYTKLARGVTLPSY